MLLLCPSQKLREDYREEIRNADKSNETKHFAAWQGCDGKFAESCRPRRGCKPKDKVVGGCPPEAVRRLDHPEFLRA